MVARNFMIASAVLLLAACAVETREDGQTETIEDRAQARWDHLLSGNYQEAWKYYSPGFRAATSVSQFERLMLARQVQWTDAIVLRSECDGQRCQVVTSVSYRVPGGPTGVNQMQVARDVRETWLWLDGNWWYAQN